MTEPTPILTYDKHDPAKGRGSTRVILFFWLGLLIFGCAQAALRVVRLHDTGPAAAWMPDAIVPPLAGAAVLTVSGTLFLGLSLWARLKVVKEIAYRQWWAALATGLAYGAMGPQIFTYAPNRFWTTGFVVAYCAGLVIFPTAAGFWLCYRSHLRE